MSKIYDYVFYSIYKNTIIINKSIPEWSTIITISILLALNIFSVLIFVEYDVKKIGREGFGALPVLITGVNYLYFLKNKRHLCIIKRYDNIKNRLVWDVIVLIYACVSIAVLFHLIGMDRNTTVFFIGFIILTALIPFFIRNKKK